MMEIHGHFNHTFRVCCFKVKDFVLSSLSLLLSPTAPSTILKKFPLCSLSRKGFPSPVGQVPLQEGNSDLYKSENALWTHFKQYFKGDLNPDKTTLSYLAWPFKGEVKHFLLIKMMEILKWCISAIQMMDFAFGMKEKFSEGQDKMKLWNLYEEQGVTFAVPWNSTQELVFGMKFSSPLPTELTKHSIFPGHVLCLFNWSASPWGECVLHLEQVHNWGDPAPVTEIPLESAHPAQEQTEPLWDQADAQVRYCLCARKKTQKCIKKAPPELWSTSSSWIKQCADKKCAACINW